MHDIISLLSDQLRSQTMLDWVITVTALMYVFLAARENAWCWVWGIVSCALWAYADFARYNLWVDGVLQLFYVVMGGWGLYTWRFGKNKGNALLISTLPWKVHLIIFSAGMTLTLVMGYVFEKYTPTALPYPDSFVTSFSIIATLMTVRKILENWLYWIVLDVLAVFLFLARDAVLIAMVMGVYAIIAVFGFFHWHKQWKKANKPVTPLG